MSQTGRAAPADDAAEEFIRAARRILLTFRPRHPAQFVASAFALAVLGATGLLMLPAAAAGGVQTTFLQALFTATSAVCVTGLTVVDTSTHWSVFGQVVILIGVSLGGFGIMAAASLLGLLVSRRLGLRTKLATAAETKALGLGEVGWVLRRVAQTTLTIEMLTAVILALRLWLSYGESPGRAAYLGVFHAISAFNNAGFALYSDSLMRFVGDPVISLSVVAAMLLGALGFPVLLELRRELRTPATWSLHTNLTLAGTAVLVVLGTAAVTAFEWTNPRTLGPLDLPGKLLAGFFAGTMPRSGGFHTVDYSAMNEETWLVSDALMFIGGGSAGTAGGIKVTTFFLLLFAILAEVRGDPDINVFRRRVSTATVRQALSVALLGVAVVLGSTLFLLGVSGLDLDRVLFEVISAAATVGLSTGVTASLPPAGQGLLIFLMYLGRTSTITLASALALRQSRRLYRLPEERPTIG
ncbi:MAG: TrkH family potassium uptake protein [Actinomycetota bacterium]|nr:TrkH family potassium uptake protein [Actinomycetota bacterium]